VFQNIGINDMNFLDNGKVIGTVKKNKNISFKNSFIRPMVRNGKRIILSIGRVNYAFLDKFIMDSLNHYYANIQTTKDEKERNRRITEYNVLYQLWYKVNTARQNQDIMLNSYYDDIVYKLYLLGYHN